MSGKGKGSKGKVEADAYMEANYVFDVSNQVPCKRQRLPNQNRAVVISEPIDGTDPHPGLCIELDDDISNPGDEESQIELQEKENAEYLASVFKALSIEVNVRDLPASWLRSVRSSMTYLAGDEFSTPAMMLLKSSTLLEGGLLSKRDVLKFMSFASSCKEDYTWNSLKDVQLAQWLAYIGATTVSEQQLFLLFDEGITSPRKLVAIDDEVLRTFGLTKNDLNMYVTVSLINSTWFLYHLKSRHFLRRIRVAAASNRLSFTNSKDQQI